MRWEWDTPWAFSRGATLPLLPLCGGPQSYFDHGVRDGIRGRELQAAAALRPECAGVESGVDRAATFALHDKKGPRALNSSERGVLDSILTLAPRMQAHWHAAGLAPNGDCPFCPGVPETRCHLFWGCPRGDGIRQEELGVARPDVEQ